MTMHFSANEDFALQLDAEDPLRQFREQFHLPLGKDAKPVIYFAGNSLGLMPKPSRQIVEEELQNWAKLGVDAHHAAGTPWYTYHQSLRNPVARLVGAKAVEVICMNSLTVNLHLMMATFYRPTKSRFKLLMEEPAFPSDTYAIKTQIIHHGLDPKDALVLVRPRKGEFTIRTEDFIELIAKHADQLAVVIIGAVNFFSGQLFDIAEITAAAQNRGIVVGFDLAHAIGNVPLSLHQWNVDFAVWCSYKYLNSGPGAVAGARLCTNAMRQTRSCRGSQDGLGTIQIRDSACISSRSLCLFRPLTVGRLAIRPFSPWRRCAPRWRFLMKRAGWNRSVRSPSNSPVTWNF